MLDGRNSHNSTLLLRNVKAKEIWWKNISLKRMIPDTTSFNRRKIKLNNISTWYVLFTLIFFLFSRSWEQYLKHCHCNTLT